MSFVVIVFFSSCRNEHTYSYSIKDFRKSLQPFLSNVVSKGIVTYHDRSYIESITDDELIRLGESEHPILRATAFQEMLHRSSFNHFDLLMNHLDDTALVATDNGEFGIGFSLVSDDILENATWTTYEAKKSTIERVLTKHNYLRSAYIILDQIEPHEKFYVFIKDMATRPRHLDPAEGYELGFDDIEYALYGLAGFKKKDDVEIIKNKLMEHVWELSDVSFRLMKEYPDTAYLSVLQSYHRRQFYRFSGNRPHGFSGFIADRAAPEDFIQALAVQENERSARLLDTMLTLLPKYTCLPDSESIISEVVSQIWMHPCSAYLTLRQKIKPKAEKLLNGRSSFPTTIYSTQIDTTQRAFGWNY